jgi:hypothetical protein
MIPVGGIMLTSGNNKVEKKTEAVKNMFQISYARRN